MAPRRQKLESALERMKTDPAEFRRHLLIEVNGRPARFPSVVKLWQARDFAALDASWQRIAGVPYSGPTPMRFVSLRARGGSKTADAALSSLWALWASRHPITGIVGAGSKEQAAHVIRRIRSLIGLNPFLGSTIDVQRGAVLNKQTGSELQVLASDSALGFGWIASYIIADELCHWPSGSGEDFWAMLLSTAAKRDCLLGVLTNAGTLGSWPHRACEALRKLPSVYYSQTDEHETLLTDEQVEEQRAILPPLHFDRYIRNRWTRPINDGIDEALILNAMTDRYSYPMDPTDQRNRGWVYIGGFDLSATSDHAAASVLAVNSTLGKIRLAWSRRFEPNNGKVDLISAVQAIRAANEKYHPVSWHSDSFESRRLQQEMKMVGARVVIESMQGANASRMAAALLTALNGEQLELHSRETGMIADLRSVTIVERSGVLRVVADRNARGHCDQAFSLIVMLPAAQELASNRYAGGPCGISFASTSTNFRRHGVLLSRRGSNAGNPLSMFGRN